MFRIITDAGEFFLKDPFTNDKTLRLDKNTEYKSEFTEKVDQEKTQEYLQTTDVPTAQNYKEFIDFLKRESKRQIVAFYYFFLDADTFFIFRGDFEKIALISKYKTESTRILSYLKKILNINKKRNYCTICVNSENSYNIIVSWQVLDILLTKEYLKENGEEVFHCFKHKSKNGKIRDIVAPHEKIKAPLRELNALLQKIYDRRNSKIQVAYKKGKSVVSGAQPHKEEKFIFNLDIHDFYPSCKKELVRRYTSFLFSSSINRTFLEEEFLDVITMNGGLFIGSPISGTLANAIISRPVSFMANICKKYGLTLTVYADDISFSSNRRISKKFVEGIFTASFEKYGLTDYFKINEKKSVGFSGCHRKVTGVSINNENKLTVPTRYFRQLRTEIEHLANSKSNVNVQKLRGKIAYATMLDETGKVYRYLKKFSDTVREYHLCSEEKLKSLEEKFGE